MKPWKALPALGPAHLLTFPSCLRHPPASLHKVTPALLSVPVPFFSRSWPEWLLSISSQVTFFFSFCKPFYLRFIYIQKNAQIINVERNDFLWTKWTHLCNPHPSQSIECYQHLRSFLLCHFPTVISSKVTTNLSLPAFELHMNRITQCISLRVQILSFIAFVRIICVLHVEVVVLFLLLYSTSFIHLLYSGRLTFGFYCVNIMDNAVVNIWIPVL